MNPLCQPQNTVRLDAGPDTSDTQSAESDTLEIAPNVKALARALGIARSTVYEWFKLPGHPAKRADGGFDVGEWREFAQSIGSDTEAGQSEDKEELQKEELRLKNEQRRKAIERADGLWTWNETLASDIAARVNEALSVLRSKFERELPSLYTSDQARNRALNKEAIDEVCERLNRPLPCQEGDAHA